MGNGDLSFGLTREEAREGVDPDNALADVRIRQRVVGKNRR